MLRIGLRAHLTGFLVTGTLGFVTLFTVMAGFAASAGHTTAERAAFGRQMQAFAAQIAYLLPLPLHPETAGGYVQWRGYSFMPVIVGFWALMAATGAIRNEEERGLLELWLASGVGRLRLVAARCAAFAAAAAAVVALTALGGLAGAAWVKESLDVTGLAQVSLALVGITLACFAIGLAAAQLVVSRRAAAGLGGIVLLALFFLDSLGRVRHDLSDWARVSPFALFDSTTALAPGGSFDVAATVALFAIALVLGVLSAVGQRRRDLGASLLPRSPVMEQARRTPSANPLLRVPVLSALYEQRIAVLAWSVGTVLTAVYMIALAKSSASLVAGNVAFQAYFRGTGTSDPVLLLLGLFWFGVAALLVVAYAITQVARWAADDSEGRLEMILAQPVPRWRVVAERGLALMAVAVLLASLGLLVVAVGAPSQGIRLDGGRLLLATALLVPLGAMFGAVGSAVIARLPGLAVSVLSAMAVVGYLLTQLGPLFKWPDWALNLSVFRLYGTPLTSGVYWTGLYAMVAVVVVGFGIGLVAMRFREVGR